jgi:hypothetical protein
MRVTEGNRVEPELIARATQRPFSCWVVQSATRFDELIAEALAFDEDEPREPVYSWSGFDLA